MSQATSISDWTKCKAGRPVTKAPHVTCHWMPPCLASRQPIPVEIWWPLNFPWPPLEKSLNYAPWRKRSSVHFSWCMPTIYAWELWKDVTQVTYIEEKSVWVPWESLYNSNLCHHQNDSGHLGAIFLNTEFSLSMAEPPWLEQELSDLVSRVLLKISHRT